MVKTDNLKQLEIKKGKIGRSIEQIEIAKVEMQLINLTIEELYGSLRKAYQEKKKIEGRIEKRTACYVTELMANGGDHE